MDTLTVTAGSFTLPIDEEGSGQRDELAAAAHGIALPDGGAVTYCVEDEGSEPPLRVWPTVAKAANHWGAYVLWHNRGFQLSGARWFTDSTHR